jgi:kinesin family protein 6/9
VHVPYRNSLMTLVLRDSLGGNCRTVMVATVSGEAQHMEESISTCRFAQRVALVRNEVRGLCRTKHHDDQWAGGQGS